MAGMEQDLSVKRIQHISKSWIRVAIAAAIFLIASAGVIFYLYKSDQAEKVASIYVNNIVPGKNSATLTMANGQRIVLGGIASGKLADQAGVDVFKTSSGEIVYERSGAATGKNLLNTLSTARGEEYEVVLPDGTKVWLNAESSIKYPVTFANLKSRRVILNGEAYFEVTKDKSHPFIVETNQQQVEVLGTHFNINSYANENVIKTTLLEGLVKITPSISNHTQVLKPGHQAQLTASGLKILEVNAESAIDWKKGSFVFENESLGAILRKVSRWYNIDFEYQDEALTKVTFTGILSRYDKVTKVLSKLELTKEVKFNVGDKKIIVTPN